MRLPLVPLVLAACACVRCDRRPQPLPVPNTPTIIVLAEKGDVKQLEELLLYGVSANEVSQVGSTPLITAAAMGHADAVRLLLKYGAAVNLNDPVGHSPLHFACMGGDSECVRLLLAAGAPVDHRARSGMTPLISAAIAGADEDVVSALLGAGANPCLKDNGRRTALHYCKGLNESREGDELEQGKRVAAILEAAMSARQCEK